MNAIVLLEPMTYLRHDPAQGFCDSPDALVYTGQDAAVRFDKATGQISLDPPDADLARLLQALQALAMAQHDQEKARLLSRLAQRPF